MIRRLQAIALVGGAAVGLAALVVVVAAVELLSQSGQGQAAECAVTPPPTASGSQQIPGSLIPLYQQAAASYRLGSQGWAWLAAVNRVETDFGRNLATSSAGAVGWMQFEPATWATFGVDADRDGRKDPYVPADAISAAARYLSSLGAPADWQTAIRAYNGGPGNARAAATLPYWQAVAGDALAYLANPSPTAGCEPCAAPGPQLLPETLVAYDPAAVPDAAGGEGFTPAGGTDYSVGREPQIAQRLDLLGRTLQLRLTGISGYRTPAHSVAVGGGSRDPHTRGEASDTLGVEAVPEATLERFGLTRPFDRLLPGGGHTDPAEADHIQLEVTTAGDNASAPTALPPAACSDGGAIPLAPGDRAQIDPDGRAAAPASAPPEVRAMIAAGNELIGRPYLYGGGHAGWTLASGYDCSSSVSWALHGGGFLTLPEDSTTLEGFGLPGAGLWVTVYANPGHAFVDIAGIRLDTSPQTGDGRLRQLGPRWRPATRSSAGFVARHPPGL